MSSGAEQSPVGGGDGTGFSGSLLEQYQQLVARTNLGGDTLNRFAAVNNNVCVSPMRPPGVSEVVVPSSVSLSVSAASNLVPGDPITNSIPSLSSSALNENQRRQFLSIVSALGGTSTAVVDVKPTSASSVNAMSVVQEFLKLVNNQNAIATSIPSTELATSSMSAMSLPHGGVPLNSANFQMAPAVAGHPPSMMYPPGHIPFHSYGVPGVGPAPHGCYEMPAGYPAVGSHLAPPYFMPPNVQSVPPPVVGGSLAVAPEYRGGSMVQGPSVKVNYCVPLAPPGVSADVAYNAQVDAFLDKTKKTSLGKPNSTTQGASSGASGSQSSRPTLTLGSLHTHSSISNRSSYKKDREKLSSETGEKSSRKRSRASAEHQRKKKTSPSTKTGHKKKHRKSSSSSSETGSDSSSYDSDSSTSSDSDDNNSFTITKKKQQRSASKSSSTNYDEKRKKQKATAAKSVDKDSVATATANASASGKNATTEKNVCSVKPIARGTGTAGTVSLAASRPSADDAGQMQGTVERVESYKRQLSERERGLFQVQIKLQREYEELQLMPSTQITSAQRRDRLEENGTKRENCTNQLKMVADAIRDLESYLNNTVAASLLTAPDTNSSATANAFNTTTATVMDTTATKKGPTVSVVHAVPALASSSGKNSQTPPAPSAPKMATKEPEVILILGAAASSAPSDVYPPRPWPSGKVRGVVQRLTCSQCHVICGNLKSYLDHLHSDRHKKTADREGVSWMSERLRSRDPKVDEDLLAATAKGPEYIEPCFSFMCRLCKVISVDSYAVAIHMKSEQHLANYNKKLLEESSSVAVHSPLTAAADSVMPDVRSSATAHKATVSPALPSTSATATLTGAHEMLLPKKMTNNAATSARPPIQLSLKKPANKQPNAIKIAPFSLAAVKEQKKLSAEVPSVFKRVVQQQQDDNSKDSELPDVVGNPSPPPNHTQGLLPAVNPTSVAKKQPMLQQLVAEELNKKSSKEGQPHFRSTARAHSTSSNDSGERYRKTSKRKKNRSRSKSSSRSTLRDRRSRDFQRGSRDRDCRSRDRNGDRKRRSRSSSVGSRSSYYRSNRRSPPRRRSPSPPRRRSPSPRRPRRYDDSPPSRRCDHRKVAYSPPSSRDRVICGAQAAPVDKLITGYASQFIGATSSAATSKKPNDKQQQPPTSAAKTICNSTGASNASVNNTATATVTTAAISSVTTVMPAANSVPVQHAVLSGDNALNVSSAVEHPGETLTMSRNDDPGSASVRVEAAAAAVPYDDDPNEVSIVKEKIISMKCEPVDEGYHAQEQQPAAVAEQQEATVPAAVSCVCSTKLESQSVDYDTAVQAPASSTMAVLSPQQTEVPGLTAQDQAANVSVQGPARIQTSIKVECASTELDQISSGTSILQTVNTTINNRDSADFCLINGICRFRGSYPSPTKHGDLIEIVKCTGHTDGFLTVQQKICSEGMSEDLLAEMEAADVSTKNCLFCFHYFLSSYLTESMSMDDVGSVFCALREKRGAVEKVARQISAVYHFTHPEEMCCRNAGKHTTGFSISGLVVDGVQQMYSVQICLDPNEETKSKRYYLDDLSDPSDRCEKMKRHAERIAISEWIRWFYQDFWPDFMQRTANQNC